MDRRYQHYVSRFMQVLILAANPWGWVEADWARMLHECADLCVCLAVGCREGDHAHGHPSLCPLRMLTCWCLGLMGLLMWILESSLRWISVTVMMHLSCLLALWGKRVGARPRVCRDPGLLTCVLALGVVKVRWAAGWLPLIMFHPCLLTRGCLTLSLSLLLWILCGSLPKSFLLLLPLR